ncbi:MAG: PIN domain-containing protein, partial [Planctomycetota bacterium]|nr:PIN domain-containing protein [Planctomycetota bacterium]
MSQEKSTKIFVLDTNVILHDSNSIQSFHEHDIAIPITVLEEVDQFKKGHNDINFQAREFLRKLDGLTGDLLSDDGAPLGEERGNIRVILARELDPRLRSAFLQDCPDHRILNTALGLTEIHSEREVILVSKDTNVRMKAKAFGVRAQDYARDKLESLDKLYAGMRKLETSNENVDLFYQQSEPVPVSQVEGLEAPVANENFIIRSGTKSVLATYNRETDDLHRVDKCKSYGISPRNAEQSFALHALTNDSIKLVTLVGKAGTGKTLLALAAALQNRSHYRQILLARPVVPLSNKDLGYLPGDIS